MRPQPNFRQLHRADAAHVAEFLYFCRNVLRFLPAMNASFLARLDSLVRPFAVRLPAPLAVRLYSQARKVFLHVLVNNRPVVFEPPAEYQRVLWGIPFRSPVFNAAGMYKNGEGYEVSARQGAGAYLAGTTTTFARTGNTKAGAKLPFAPYPTSGAASNWLGLPNKGHAEVARRLAALGRINGCPVGISIMGAPESSGKKALEELADAMALFDKARVDFIELNESCPNAGHAHADMQDLAERLEYLSTAVLRRRQRPLPVVVKFSTDTQPGQVQALVDMLLTLHYDGINFGNTSTAYARHRAEVASADRPLYDYFTSTFGGGLSGRLLKADSLRLASMAASYVAEKQPNREFHSIRTGGIESAADLAESDRAGISLNQWYTGYFERFSRDGHNVYRALLREAQAAGFAPS